MKFIDCPHCYVRVGVGTPEVCPSCSKDANDLTGVDPDRQPFVLKVRGSLPDLCCGCGAPTDRRRKVEAWSSYLVPGSERPSGCFYIIAFLVGWIFWPLKYLMIEEEEAMAGGNRRIRQKMKLRIGQCSDCASEPIEVIDHSHETGWIKLVVHRRFREDYERLNPVAETDRGGES